MGARVASGAVSVAARRIARHSAIAQRLKTGTSVVTTSGESAMSKKDHGYPEAQFGGFAGIDGTIAFSNRVNALLTPAIVVLDLGCGRGKGRAAPVLLRRI
jgi:hypothetical protein